MSRPGEPPSAGTPRGAALAYNAGDPKTARSMANPRTVTDEVAPRPAVEDAKSLLRQCFALYRAKLVDIARTSLDMASDLFEGNDYVSDDDVALFRTQRAQWVTHFGESLASLFERRLSGVKRKGRRPDFDASLASLRVLTAFDHEKQDALKSSTSFLLRLTRRELDALDLRLELLLPESDRLDLDNPFGPAYVLDAIGSTSRAIYPDARVWRPVMERLLADLTPAINKIYISLNRFLADRNVLPEIKAALRARSEFRPSDDRDLLPAFSKLMAEAGELPTNVIVPEILADPNVAPAFDFAQHAVSAPAAAGGAATRAAAPVASGAPLIAPEIIAGLKALAQMGSAGGGAPRAAEPAAGDLPSLDPLMALGSSTPLFTTLGQWQRLDLASALAHVAPSDTVNVGVPLNLVPHIRSVIADQITNPTDKITVDVISLLFDYIFRDPSIPQSERNLFGRLQVPIVKVALLDRTFFSDKAHPARRLLDHLAEAAIGAQNDDGYRAAFELAASGVIDDICRDFEIDVTTFGAANQKLAQFIDDERRAAATAAQPDVDEALAAEEREADRSVTRALVRDRLAGLELPLEVRSFAETTWADYLGDVRARHGEDSDPYRRAVSTLDDLLWSIVAKERTGQKARLTKLIPTLIRGLREGIAARGVTDDRAKLFLDELYQLHMAAIKPPAPVDEVTAAAAQVIEAAQSRKVSNVYDYVSEMPPGTWLAFRREGDAINARLTWVSPLRTKYIFTSRARRRAFVFSPEELAYELGSGRAALVVEPVPLFDRAVSAALDTLAANKPPPEAGAEAAPLLAPA
jgi:hypothetical protein